jgi:hypothetical protein
MNFKNSIVEATNQLISELDTFDFQVVGIDRLHLVIAGSSDFIYYHTLEIRFRNPQFFSGPLSWSVETENSPFSLLSGDQIKNMEHSFDNKSQFMMTQFHTTDKTSVLIMAESFSIDDSVVYYYPRENLKEKEKIAAWVQHQS